MIGTTLAAVAAVVTLAASAPSWQRQPAESCAQYAVRIEQHDFELWRGHWCGDGPCFTGSGATRSAAGFSVHPYWLNQSHGCNLTVP